MNNSSLIKAFWNCGDAQIIDYAIFRARLNRHEKEVIRLVLDGCNSQEQTAERLCISVRSVQDYWSSAVRKLLSIPWVTAYAKELINK